MSQAVAKASYKWDETIEDIVTEDDEPVGNLFSAKQQTLLKRALYSSWTPPPDEAQPKKRRKFLADANVGIFFARHHQPLVPDFFLSLDVQPHKDWFEKEHRTYFVWEFGKVPEVALEIVSNRKGHELNGKLKDYARMGVSYYVVYDPNKHLSKYLLSVYELGFGKRYRRRDDYYLPEVSLSLTFWQGAFEDHEDVWIRWCDATGKLIPTGEEGRDVEAAARRVEATARRKAEAKLRKEAKARKQAEERAARLAAKLRALGIDPDQE